MPSSTSNVCLYFLAIFLPFVAVALKLGSPPIGCADVLINVAFAQVIHAWWCISRAERAPPRVVHTAGGPGRAY
ncbi:hypothetical protein JCM8097_008417 [Rhodosporidiobolus ruineniae]